MKKSITGIILAGGKNSRMGTHKAFLKFGKKFLIELIIDIHLQFTKNIIIVTDDKKRFKKISNVELVEDEISYRGPLSGMLYGLKATNNYFNLITSCDSPFIQKNLVEHLINIAFKEKEYDIVIPYLENKYEPLLAIYSTACIQWIQKTLDNNCFKITDFFTNVKIKKVFQKEIVKFDPEFKSFININTPQEFFKYSNLNIQNRVDI